MSSQSQQFKNSGARHSPCCSSLTAPAAQQTPPQTLGPAPQMEAGHPPQGGQRPQPGAICSPLPLPMTPVQLGYHQRLWQKLANSTFFWGVHQWESFRGTVLETAKSPDPRPSSTPTSQWARPAQAPQGAPATSMAVLSTCPVPPSRRAFLPAAQVLCQEERHKQVL